MMLDPPSGTIAAEATTKDVATMLSLFFIKPTLLPRVIAQAIHWKKPNRYKACLGINARRMNRITLSSWAFRSGVSNC